MKDGRACLWCCRRRQGLSYANSLASIYVTDPKTGGSNENIREREWQASGKKNDSANEGCRPLFSRAVSFVRIFANVCINDVRSLVRRGREREFYFGEMAGCKKRVDCLPAPVLPAAAFIRAQPVLNGDCHPCPVLPPSFLVSSLLPDYNLDSQRKSPRGSCLLWARGASRTPLLPLPRQQPPWG